MVDLLSIHYSLFKKKKLIDLSVLVHVQEKLTTEAKQIKTDSTENSVSNADVTKADEEEADKIEDNDEEKESDGEQATDDEDDEESISEFSREDQNILQKAGKRTAGSKIAECHFILARDVSTRM